MSAHEYHKQISRVLSAINDGKKTASQRHASFWRRPLPQETVFIFLEADIPSSR
jgi:hypothetical protein